MGAPPGPGTDRLEVARVRVREGAGEALGEGDCAVRTARGQRPGPGAATGVADAAWLFL